MKHFLCIAILVVVIGLWITGCGNTYRPSPQAAVLGEAKLIDDEKLVNGRKQFNLNCYQCHPGGAAGLAPAINDKPLPEGLIKLQIRRGLGAMPAFNEQHLSDEDVDAIVRYLKYMRDQRHVAQASTK